MQETLLSEASINKCLEQCGNIPTTCSFMGLRDCIELCTVYPSDMWGTVIIVAIVAVSIVGIAWAIAWGNR